MKKIKLKGLLKEEVINKNEDFKKTKRLVERILQKYNVEPIDIANIFRVLEQHVKK